jgi:hypothetical protein
MVGELLDATVRLIERVRVQATARKCDSARFDVGRRPGSCPIQAATCRDNSDRHRPCCSNASPQYL